MKNKLKLLMLFMFAGILSLQAQQQGFQRRTVEERVKSTLEKISDSLKLSAAQQKDATTTFTEYYKSMEKLREGMEPGVRPDKADFEKIIAARDEKLKTIFTPEQFKQFKEVLEPSMRRPRGDRGQGSNGDRGGQGNN
jgi:5'-deoxynucleotidase YfbR-like HD superfamily hydrolase